MDTRRMTGRAPVRACRRVPTSPSPAVRPWRSRLGPRIEVAIPVTGCAAAREESMYRQDSSRSFQRGHHPAQQASASVHSGPGRGGNTRRDGPGEPFRRPGLLRVLQPRGRIRRHHGGPRGGPPPELAGLRSGGARTPGQGPECRCLVRGGLRRAAGSWLVDCIKGFSATASVSEVTYFRRLVRMFQALGAQGECLIVGRGSSFVLPSETTLRVRIVAAREDRVAFITQDRDQQGRGRPVRRHQGQGSGQVHQGPLPQGPGRSAEL